jgi:5-methylcytosine-specific restriction endonuclease McrA
MLALNIDDIKLKATKTGLQGRTARKKLSILEKCGFKCVTCGSTRNLTIAHIIPIRKGQHRHQHISQFKIDNCKIQCVECHTISHKRKP